MNEEILINFTPQETRVALVQHGQVQELLVERAQNRGILSNIYLGKVMRVLPGMQSAFVDIGLEKSGFIHVADLYNHADLPIEKLVFEGQTILVQVLKDPLGTKGARLTTHLSIAGRNLVYLPLDEKNGQIGVSQRITEDSDRDELKQRVRQIMPESLKGCLIVRTSAEEATDADLAQDLEYLLLTWARIYDLTLKKPTPSKLYEDLNLIERVMRDIAEETTIVIRIDSAENFNKLQQFATTYMPKLYDKIQLYRGERPLFDMYDIENEINLALNRRVNLKSGGYLMIDQTESMTTIDVNTGSYIGAKTFVDTIYKTNLEAAKAIAKQLRLRNLGGIIIVDFIDMHIAEHQTAVLAELEKSLALDRMKTTVNQFSNLGLVEMTRKRTRESLAHQLCEPCPTCHGKGEIKTAQTICYEILREIVREHRQFNPKEFRIVASPDVIDLFLEEQSQYLAELGEFINKPIRLRAEADFAQEHYDIVLL
jgi:ribonuclease G